MALTFFWKNRILVFQKNYGDYLCIESSLMMKVRDGVDFLLEKLKFYFLENYGDSSFIIVFILLIHSVISFVQK